MLKRWEQAISLFAFAWFGCDPNLCSKFELEFIVRKPMWSRTEAFENRGLIVFRKSCHKKLQNKIKANSSIHAVIKFFVTLEASRSCEKKWQKLQ